MPGLAGRDAENYRFLLKLLLKSNDFDCLGWPGAAGRDREKYQLLKFLLTSNDFDCPGWPGAAGMEKSIDFYEKSIEKITVLIARAGQEWPGWRKV